MPELYIITGSNGAGKSTVGPEYLPAHIHPAFPVFDGDKLFIQKRNELWKTIQAPKEVRKLAFAFVVETLEAQVEHALIHRQHYVYEGHFTNEATWDIPRRFKKSGYSVHLLFFGLKDPDISELRVIKRSEEGGHWVDRQTIEGNFAGNLEKLTNTMHSSMICK
jgi:predicted ABC-type ATPase